MTIDTRPVKHLVVVSRQSLKLSDFAFLLASGLNNPLSNYADIPEGRQIEGAAEGSHMRQRPGGECSPSTKYEGQASKTTTTSTTFDICTEFVHYLAARRCPGCDTSLIRVAKAVDALFKKWVSGDSVNLTKTKIEGAKLEWCCSRGGIFMIWVLLCGFDQQYSVAKLKEAATKGPGQATHYGGRRGARYAANDYKDFAFTPITNRVTRQGMFGHIA
ncbi:hypothetical protein K458DRAFT_406650 [Lentithecium fluviatile CBS 122367]|uniref:Uncharacterized protein n=1 Tax=Lentithecium fluviatile CBS 122367 TaxID=1168545 RepID=A0A6G1IT17_9PLEO|nr:hypothetical protein K458DRAFT_406650 [Lentithecium fluviatile CBS 122367]